MDDVVVAVAWVVASPSRAEEEARRELVRLRFFPFLLL